MDTLRSILSVYAAAGRPPRAYGLDTVTIHCGRRAVRRGGRSRRPPCATHTTSLQDAPQGPSIRTSAIFLGLFRRPTPIVPMVVAGLTHGLGWLCPLSMDHPSPLLDRGRPAWHNHRTGQP